MQQLNEDDFLHLDKIYSRSAGSHEDNDRRNKIQTLPIYIHEPSITPKINSDKAKTIFGLY